MFSAGLVAMVDEFGVAAEMIEDQVVVPLDIGVNVTRVDRHLRSDPSDRQAYLQPPEIAPRIMKGSVPAATAAGTSVSGDSWDRSLPSAK